MDEYKNNKFSESSAKYILRTNNLSLLADQPKIVNKLRQNMYNLDSYFRVLINDIKYDTVKPLYVWGNERVEGENLEYMVNKLKKFIGQYGGAIEDEMDNRINEKIGLEEGQSIENVIEENAGFKIIDWVQVGLDIAGFIPAAGIPIDALNMVISLVRGYYMDAMFSLINILPVIGSFIGTPIKYLMKYLNYINRAKKDVNVEDAVESDSEYESSEEYY